MANDNDVVRLKHLQPLVSGVANDFSIQNGDNAVRLKHLVSLATALDNDKQAPVLSLGSWSSADTVYSAPITYTGDGTLSTDIGTIANDILTVEDVDGNFNGIISASSGYDYAATKINFNYMTDTVTVEGEPATVTVEAEPVTVTVEAEPVTVTVQADPKTNPTFSLGEWAGSNNTYSAVVSYNGDGVLTANTGTLSGSTITVSDADGNFSGVISAAEGTNFAPSNLVFTHSKETVGGGQKLEPTLTVGDSFTWVSSKNAYYWTYTYNGDGEILAWGDSGSYTDGGMYSLSDVYKGTAAEVDTVNKRIYYHAKAPDISWGIYVYATEGKNYAAKGEYFEDSE